jgi:hypothetical protein
VVVGDCLAEAPKEVLLFKLLLKSMVFVSGKSMEKRVFLESVFLVFELF